jgi:low affinity Fe/Cu permease
MTVNRAAGAIADRPSLSARFERIATAVAQSTGRPVPFAIAFVLIVGWAMTGPIFHYSNSWQLLINTRSSILRLLMVILIQNAQSRHSAALHAKLDELIRATDAARDAYMGIETLPPEKVEQMRKSGGEAEPSAMGITCPSLTPTPPDPAPAPGLPEYPRYARSPPTGGHSLG